MWNRLSRYCCCCVNKTIIGKNTQNRLLSTNPQTKSIDPFVTSLPPVVHAKLSVDVTAGKRLLVVGDVHGCVRELEDLFDRVSYDAKQDVIIFTGDLVAKGPSSKEVLNLARSMPNTFGVRGNHDHYVVMHQTVDSHPDSEHSNLANGILGKENLDWLSNLPLTLFVEEYNLLVVHAGVKPGIAIEDNTVDDLLHMRNILPSGEPSNYASEGDPWVKHYNGDAHVVFGHDAVRGVQSNKFSTGLDTGCVYGGSLSCLELPSWDIISVPAREMYVTPASKQPKKEMQEDPLKELGGVM